MAHFRRGYLDLLDLDLDFIGSAGHRGYRMNALIMYRTCVLCVFTTTTSVRVNMHTFESFVCVDTYATGQILAFNLTRQMSLGGFQRDNTVKNCYASSLDFVR